MKKLIMTIAIVLGLSMTTIADPNEGGLFQRGATSEQYFNHDRQADEGCPLLPNHGGWFNWDADQTPEEEEVPLGGGALLLIGFGAAYAMSRRNKKD